MFVSFICVISWALSPPSSLACGKARVIQPSLGSADSRRKKQTSSRNWFEKMLPSTTKVLMICLYVYCMYVCSPDMILCGWLGSKHQLMYACMYVCMYAWKRIIKRFKDKVLMMTAALLLPSNRRPAMVSNELVPWQMEEEEEENAQPSVYEYYQRLTQFCMPSRASCVHTQSFCRTLKRGPYPCPYPESTSRLEPLIRRK